LTSVADGRQKSVTEIRAQAWQGICVAEGSLVGTQDGRQENGEVRVKRTRCARWRRRGFHWKSGGEMQQKKCSGQRQAQLFPLAVGVFDVEEDKHGLAPETFSGFQVRSKRDASLCRRLVIPSRFEVLSVGTDG